MIEFVIVVDGVKFLLFKVEKKMYPTVSGAILNFCKDKLIITLYFFF